MRPLRNVIRFYLECKIGNFLSCFLFLSKKLLPVKLKIHTVRNIYLCMFHKCSSISIIDKIKLCTRCAYFILLVICVTIIGLLIPAENVLALVERNVFGHVV